MLGASDDAPEPDLAAVIERQRREIARLRAGTETAAVVAAARGMLMERYGWPAAEAARQLDGMAGAANLPVDEMAAVVLGQEPRAARAEDVRAVAVAEHARGGGELVAALAGQVIEPLGAAAVAVWLLEPDGALSLLGQAGLNGTEASRWRRLPPQFDCPQQRVARGGTGLWWPAGPPEPGPHPVADPWERAGGRAVLPLRDRGGTLLGVAQAWWSEPLPEFTPQVRDRLSAAADGFAALLGLRPAREDLGSAAPDTVWAVLGHAADCVLVARPVHGTAGQPADFAIVHLSPGFVDPAGRPPAELDGLSLLEAYPASGAGDGLAARVARVHATGRAEHVPGLVPGLTGRAEAVDVADLRVAPLFGDVVCAWRAVTEARRRIALLEHVQRLARLGGWDEDFATGTVHWTDAAFAVFGLDPAQAMPIPLADLHSFVIAADGEAIRRFRDTLMRRAEAAAASFRVVWPGDATVRQVRAIAEPVLTGGGVTGARGVFQDVSARYLAQVALAATREELADTERRAAEDHRLALRLQHAIMSPDAVPVEAAGVDVAVRYRSAEPGRLVGGDWYDVLALPGGDLLLVVGDVAGHGIGAVTGMVAARNALRGLAATGAWPAELIRHLNSASCHFADGIAGTVVVGRYQPGTGLLRWARAGHLPPVLVRDGRAAALPLPAGALLGLDPGAGYQEAQDWLRPGDVLVLFTDGLIERRDRPVDDALAALVEAIVPGMPDAAGHADSILASVMPDTGDDACLVVVRVTGTGETAPAASGNPG